MEFTVFDSSIGQYFLELPHEVVNRAVALIEFPPTFLDQLKPETRQLQVSKIKHVVDELLDSESLWHLSAGRLD